MVKCYWFQQLVSLDRDQIHEMVKLCLNVIMESVLYRLNATDNKYRRHYFYLHDTI